MPQRVKKLTIKLVALVDKGANQLSDVLLYKRTEPLAKMDTHGTPMTTAEVLAHKEQCEEWRELRWAFQDSLDSIVEYATPDEQGPLLLTAVEEFAARAREILSRLDMPAAMAKRATDILDDLRMVEKAGRVIAGERLKRLKQAVGALQAIVMEAEPMAEEKKDATALAKRAEEAESLVATLQAQVGTLEKRNGELIAEVESLQPVDIWKGVAPEMRARIEKIEQENEANKQQIRKRDCITEVRKYDALPMNADDDWELIDEVNTKLSETTRKRFYTLLASAQEVAVKSGILKAVGASQTRSNGTDAYALMETKAKDLVSKGIVKTVAQGIDHVMTSDPDLYGQYLQEQQGA